jgi:hypothetical protein
MVSRLFNLGILIAALFAGLLVPYIFILGWSETAMFLTSLGFLGSTFLWIVIVSVSNILIANFLAKRKQYRVFILFLIGEMLDGIVGVLALLFLPLVD